MRTSPGGALGGDEPAVTSTTSWSIGHISGVTLAVRETAESAAVYGKLGCEVSYGGPDAPITTMRAGQSVVVEQGLGPTVPRDADWGERYFEVYRSMNSVQGA